MKSKAGAKASKPKARKTGGLTTKGKGSRVNDVAAVSETFQFENMGMNTIYADYGCSLFQHERARAVAQGYQEFRIKLVEYRFKPLSDTYNPTENTQVPYLYYLVDKARANNGLSTIDAFCNAGAKAIRFDDKTVTVKYKPAVLIDTWDATALSSVPRDFRVSPWMATNDNNVSFGLFNPSSVDHLGLRWVVQSTPGSAYTFAVERVCHIEFRKPMWIEQPREGEVLKVVLVDTLIDAKLNPKPIEPTV